MTGRLNLRVMHGGAATLHSIRVMQPKQVSAVYSATLLVGTRRTDLCPYGMKFIASANRTDGLELCLHAGNSTKFDIQTLYIGFKFSRQEKFAGIRLERLPDRLLSPMGWEDDRRWPGGQVLALATSLV